MVFTTIQNCDITKAFIEMVHTDIYDRFLHNLILYIDYFLMILEILLIRRDEVDAKTGNTYSIKVEQCLAKQLSDRRLLIGREYCKVIINFDQFFDGCMAQRKSIIVKIMFSRKTRLTFISSIVTVSVYGGDL